MDVWSDLTLAPEINNLHLSEIYNFWSLSEVPIDRHTHSCKIFQQKVIGLVEASDEEKPKAARSAALASRVNTMLSIPMLYSMVSAQNIY